MPGGRLTKNCQNCKKEFEATNGKRHCSEKCRNKWKSRNYKPAPKIEKVCKYKKCENTLLGNGTRKYCSEECRYKEEKITGKPVGRPTKYKKRYCEDVIEHMKNGASFTSFAAKIQVHDSQIRKWREKYEEFRIACNIAEKRSQDWWENFAMQSATGRLYDKVHKGKYDRHNPGMIQFIMKQRFYRDYNKAAYTAPEDKDESTVTYKVTMSKDGRVVQDILKDISEEEKK